jgi:RNA polymerase sigma-70 factor, ECF subfamily
MSHFRTDPAEASDTLADLELARRAVARDRHAFRAIMTSHNQRLFRLARSIVRNDNEAEDVVQEAYVRGFAHLDQFRGESSLATWLSRIVINEALGRLRKKRRTASVASFADQSCNATIVQFPVDNTSGDPERTMAQRQILQLVEQATDALPDIYRTVFVARVIEGLSVEETAELFGLRAETVKTRLHRARRLVRERLDEQIGPVLLSAFPFAGRRCERLTAAVMGRLGFAD